MQRVVAQLGRALGSGPRGRWFKSSQPDHEIGCWSFVSLAFSGSSAYSDGPFHFVFILALNLQSDVHGSFKTLRPCQGILRLIWEYPYKLWILKQLDILVALLRYEIYVAWEIT